MDTFVKKKRKKVQIIIPGIETADIAANPADTRSIIKKRLACSIHLNLKIQTEKINCKVQAILQFAQYTVSN